MAGCINKLTALDAQHERPVSENLQSLPAVLGGRLGFPGFSTFFFFFFLKYIFFFKGSFYRGSFFFSGVFRVVVFFVFLRVHV